MPNRRQRWLKPGKKIGKKQLLIPPIIIGVATLFGFIVMQISPPPNILKVCLKSHNLDTFNVYPRFQIFIDGQQKYLPDTVGQDLRDGKECTRVLHTDEVGDIIHIQYVRPIRTSLSDFLTIYSPDNKTINVVDNSTGISDIQKIILDNYNVEYSYYTEKDKFIKISNMTTIPPFSSNMLVKMNITSKNLTKS